MQVHTATIQDSIYLLGPIISITSTVLGKLKYEQRSVTAINNKESKVKKTFRKSTVSVYNRFRIEEKRRRQQQTVKKKLNLEEPNSTQPPPQKKEKRKTKVSTFNIRHSKTLHLHPLLSSQTIAILNAMKVKVYSEVRQHIHTKAIGNLKTEH